MTRLALRPQADIDTLLSERGIPYTRQRHAIWEFFSESCRAATIGEAAEALRRQGVGQATVYRAVTLYTELGLLVRVQSRSGEVCYTATRIGHSHPLVCGVCRKVVDFDGDGDLAGLEKQLESSTGFRVYGHHLEVYGICSECSEPAGGGGEGPPDASSEEV